MPPKQTSDDIWADPERVLAPSKEDLLVQGLEEIAEERLYGCWADEVLRSCLDLAASDTSYSRELFLGTRSEINQYLAVLDEIVRDILNRLQTAGRECDPALLRNPRTDIRKNIAEELGPVEDPSSKSESASRQGFACEYAEDRVVRFLSRFSSPKDELVPKYPTPSLRHILRETRRELVHCSDRADERWEAELALLLEPDVDLLPPKRQAHRGPKLKVPLRGQAT